MISRASIAPLSLMCPMEMVKRLRLYTRRSTISSQSLQDPPVITTSSPSLWLLAASGRGYPRGLTRTPHACFDLRTACGAGRGAACHTPRGPTLHAERPRPPVPDAAAAPSESCLGSVGSAMTRPPRAQVLNSLSAPACRMRRRGVPTRQPTAPSDHGDRLVVIATSIHRLLPQPPADRWAAHRTLAAGSHPQQTP